MLISKNPNDIAKIIQQGGVVAYPTEAVFGLGCNPTNQAAVRRLLDIKQRTVDKGLILIAENIEQLSDYINLTSADITNKLLLKEQKPITWLVPSTATAPRWITGKHKSIAIRISQHPACQALCRVCGHSLVSTSANPAQQAPARSKQEVIAYFNHTIDAIFDAPIGEHRTPSEIRDSQTGEIIRKG